MLVMSCNSELISRHKSNYLDALIYEIEIGIVHSMHTDKNDGLKCSETDSEHPPYFIVWAGDVAKSAK